MDGLVLPMRSTLHDDREAIYRKMSWDG